MEAITSTSNGHTLVFEEKPWHRYILDGKKVRSVTGAKEGYPTSPRLVMWQVKEGIKCAIEMCKQLLEEIPSQYIPEFAWDEILDESKGASARTMKKAAAIGTLIHDYAEQYEANKSITAKLHDDIVTHVDRKKVFSCIKKFRRWKRQNSDEVLKHEEIVASSVLNVAGKFDRLAKRRNSIVLSDWKSSSGIFTEQLLQLALYRVLISEWMGIQVDAIEIVRFGKEDGAFETKMISDPKQLADLTQQAIQNVKTCEFMERWEPKPYAKRGETTPK